MRGFDHATILSPSFHGLRKERLAQWPPISVQNTKKLQKHEILVLNDNLARYSS